MLHVTEGAVLNFHKADEQYKLRDFLEARRYRVSDSPLTYRQINNLAAVGVLSAAQEKEGEWRKFSFVEIVFLEVVYELRRFGFKTEQLAGLRKVFFKPAERKQLPNSKLPEPAGYAFMAIGLTLLEVQIILSVNAEGTVEFFDPVFFGLMQGKNKAFVYIDLNQVVNGVLKKFGSKVSFDYTTLFDLYLQQTKGLLSDKELELLHLLRNGDYETVEVVLQDGKVKVIRGTTRKRGEFTPADLVKVLEAKGYQTVTAYMQDGKVATYTVEETKK